MRSWLPLSILVLLLVGLAVFLFSENSTDTTADLGHHAAQTSELSPAEDVQAAPRPSDFSKDDGIDPVRTTISQAAPIQEFVYATPAEEGVLVSVVDGNTQKPLPRAEVMVIDTGVSDLRTLESEMTISADFEKIFERLGVIYKTDQQGQVRIPFAMDSHILAGRTSTHFNFSIDVDENTEEITLYLNPTQTLPVKVVDENGLPVEGAPVSLRVRNGQSAQDFTTSFSNQDGIAEIKLFQLLMLELADDETYAALLFLSPDPVEAKVNLKELPEKPPVLIVRDAGALEVNVQDTQGNPVNDAFVVNIDLLLPEDTYDETEDYDSWNSPREHLTGRTQNGKAFFPLVEYNQRLRVVAVSPDGELRAEAFGEGPVQNGGPAVFTLIPQAENPVLVGRILNTEGKVGPNLSLKYSLKIASEGGSTSTRGGTVQTDVDGYFRLLVEELFEEGAERSLTITMRATRKKPKRNVGVDLSYFLAPGENDLGDLVLVVPPLIASGVVVDASGKALPGAQVRLERKSFYGKDKEYSRWQGIWEHRAESGRNGEFEIRADLPLESHRLTATLKTYLDAHVPISQGDENVSIVMDKSSTLKGRFLLDEDIDVERIQAVVRIPNPDFEGLEVSIGAKIRADGSFVVKDLMPGPASLVLKSKIMEEVLFQLPELTIESPDGPQILGDIDLRGVLHTLRLWVRNTQGELIPKVVIWPGNNPNYQASSDNPFVAITRESGLDLRVTAPGYQVQEMNQISGEHEIVLPKSFQVQIEITNRHIVPEPFKLNVNLTPRHADSSTSIDDRFTKRIYNLGSSKTIDLPLHGIYSVSFSLSDPRPSSMGSLYWLKMEKFQMDVANLTTLQSFRFALDEQALLNALPSD